MLCHWCCFYESNYLWCMINYFIYNFHFHDLYFMSVMVFKQSSSWIDFGFIFFQFLCNLVCSKLHLFHVYFNSYVYILWGTMAEAGGQRSKGIGMYETPLFNSMCVVSRRHSVPMIWSFIYIFFTCLKIWTHEKQVRQTSQTGCLAQGLPF